MTPYGAIEELPYLFEADKNEIVEKIGSGDTASYDASSYCWHLLGLAFADMEMNLASLNSHEQAFALDPCRHYENAIRIQKSRL
jgi:hypothetical protein